MSTVNKAKQFNQIFMGIVLGCFVLPLALNYLLLVKSGETLNSAELVKEQLKQQAIYLSPVNQNFYRYKLELIKAKKPEIISLGSSRAMPFAAQFFSIPFTNGGGAVNAIDEAPQFLKELLPHHKPKVIIMGLDFWWFNENKPMKGATYTPYKPDEAVTWDNLIKVFEYVIEGKVSQGKYFRILTHNTHQNKFTTYNTLGISAIKNAVGFMPDGRYVYTSTYAGKDYQFKDVKFANLSERVDKGIRNFEHQGIFSTQRLKYLNEVISICQKNNIQLVFYIPPISKIIQQRMAKSGQYGYMQVFRKTMKATLSKAHLPFYDFTDLTQATGKGSDCEFVDGFHGGEVAYARMSLKMANTLPNNLGNKLFKSQALKQWINQYEGHAQIPFEPEKLKYKEVDFLKIGCKK